MNAKMSELLNRITQVLCRFLQVVLPSLGSDNWWAKYVLAELSHQQLRFVEQAGITELTGLDLAALLRVLDKNWYEISWKVTFPPDARHYVKEMQTIRNRWAHARVDQLETDDIYRDLDTLQRFASVIQAGEDLIEQLQQEKQTALARWSVAPKPEASAVSTEEKENEREAEFRPGQIVFLKSAPSSSGAVTEVHLGEPENRYAVFINGSVQSYYASQLASEEAPPTELKPYSLEHYRAYLSARQIQHPSMSNLYSLNAARVDFIPYQFRPVLKFIKAARPRLLIADGVGVGKTIEAGLILRELQARRDVKSVLIICPRPLVAERKWDLEL